MTDVSLRLPASLLETYSLQAAKIPWFKFKQRGSVARSIAKPALYRSVNETLFTPSLE